MGKLKEGLSVNKKQIEETVEENILYDLEGSLESAIEVLLKYQRTHPNSYLEETIEWEVTQLRLFSKRDETDAEYSERLRQEGESKRMREVHDLRLLKKLKEQYPDE